MGFTASGREMKPKLSRNRVLRRAYRAALVIMSLLIATCFLVTISFSDPIPQKWETVRLVVIILIAFLTLVCWKLEKYEDDDPQN